MRRTFVILSVAAALALAGCAPARGESGKRLAADDLIQERIGKAVSSLSLGEETARAALDSLRKETRKDRPELAAQLAVYLTRSTTTRESMGGAIIFDQLGFTTDEKLDGLLPYMKEAGPELRETLADLLGSIDRPEGGEPDFRVYEPRLGDGSDPLNAPLVIYMYQVAPAAALESALRVHPRGEVGMRENRRLVEEVGKAVEKLSAGGQLDAGEISAARSALRDLSSRRNRWLQLFAAAVIQRHAELADSEARNQLTAGADPLVLEILSR